MIITEKNITKPNSSLISHGGDKSFDIEQCRNRLKLTNNLILTLEDELQLLEEFNNFDLGRFILENKGLNGYWTAYVMLHGPKKTNLTPLETWLLNDSPAMLATQERFGIFRTELQERIKDGMSIASAPCGLMDDLLRLDYSNTKNINIVGIDFDNESLELAKTNAQIHNLSENTTFLQRNAWNLCEQNEYNILTSNGLNIYEPNGEKVVGLYKEFFKSLKPGGTLITSFLTHPPSISADSPWTNYNESDMQKQTALFVDIVQSAWRSYRTEEESRAQLEAAGFAIEKVIYDSQCMFPTIVAKK